MNKYEILRQELLAIGNFHPDEKASVSEIITELKKRRYYKFMTEHIVALMTYFIENGEDYEAEVEDTLVGRRDNRN